MRVSLEALQVQASTAEDAATALSCVDQSVPDLILLDFGLTGMNGEEVLWTLRSRPDTVSVPVLMLTGMEQALNSSADEVLAKPFELAKLRERADFWLRN